MRNIYIRLLNELKKKTPLSLATIIETKGSTPQIPGASALFSDEGVMEGTLGGGLLEADVQKIALKALVKKDSLLYKYSLSGDISSREEAICGGEVLIFVDSAPEKHANAFQDMAQSLQRRNRGVLATFISKSDAQKTSVSRYWIEDRDKSGDVFETHQALFEAEWKKCLLEGEPRLMNIQEKVFSEKTEEDWLFLEPVNPLSRLIIAGAGHIGQAMSRLGNLLSFEVTVIDDRPEFANKDRLPEADHIIVGDIGEAMRDISLSSDAYVVIVTRGHKNDADALRECINSEAAYIGMIGSVRKIKLMREKFVQEGWSTPAQFDRVYAPIGIDISSTTVEEIAISIAAQLILVRHQVKAKIKTN